MLSVGAVTQRRPSQAMNASLAAFATARQQRQQQQLIQQQSSGSNQLSSLIDLNNQ